MTNEERIQELQDKGEISGKISMFIRSEMAKTGETPDEIIERAGLQQLDDQSYVRDIVRKYIHGGRGLGKTREAILRELMNGELKGKANPNVILMFMTEAAKEKY